MEQLAANYRVTVIIIAAEIMTIIALTVAAWFDIFKFESAASPSTITTLWIAIIFIAVGSFILRRAFFNWEKLADTILLKGKSGLIKQLQSNAIILSALAEIIAIIGFVITALTGDKFQTLRASAIALIVCLINFPRRRVWEKVVESLEKLDAGEVR
ncbi:MAG: hypothetical protein ACR2N3_00435 [Pyrinomonadaceae bacterium]